MRTLSALVPPSIGKRPDLRAPDRDRVIDGPTVHVLAFIGCSTAALVSLALHQAPDPIEAYHWLYGRHPAAGYFDHPGMIGWLVALSTSAGGDTLLALRLPTIIGSGFMIWLAYLAGRRMYDARTGRLAAFLCGLVPLTARFAMEAAPDGPLLAFWMAAVWALSHAVPGDGWGWWLLSGVFTGAAMDSKYSAVFLPAGVALFLVASRAHRFWWKRWEPYAAGATALALFAPTIWWNASHGWQSFAYQGMERISQASGFQASHAFSFFRRELVMVTPVVAAGIAWAAASTIRTWHRATWADRLAVSLGVPMLAAFSLLAFARSVRAHWPAPAFLALFPLWAAFVLRRGGLWWKLQAATLFLLAAAGLAFCVLSPLRPAEPALKDADEQILRMAPAFVMTPDYHDAAELAWRLRPLSCWDLSPVGRGRKAFPAWWTPASFVGRDAAVVFDGPPPPRDLEAVRRHFTRLEGPATVEVRRPGGSTRRLEIWTARGYRPGP
jgi:4-amino-4-deoxy-L-arabinose transferase-like glycosyltransferase